MTLIELIIAMALLAGGIAAIVAGYTSGVFAITRADKSSVAAALADQQMETFRQEPYSAIAVGTTTTTPTGSDGRTYSMTTVVAWACVDSATPPACTGSVGEPVKQVTITVVDPSNNNKTLISEGSTFDSLSG